MENIKEEDMESGKTVGEQIIDEVKMKNIKEQMQKALDVDLLEEVLSSNVLKFVHKEIKYRVQRPTFEQKQIVNAERVKKYMKLLRHPDFVLEEELRKIYKTKGVDIDEMDDKMFSLEKKKEDYLLKLGKAIKDKKLKNELQIYKKEIELIQQRQQEVSIRKTAYLEFSIEQQITVYVYSYLTFLIAEKQEKDKWIPVWKSYDEFTRDDSRKVDKITFYASLIISDELNRKVD